MGVLVPNYHLFLNPNLAVCERKCTKRSILQFQTKGRGFSLANLRDSTAGESSQLSEH